MSRTSIRSDNSRNQYKFQDDVRLNETELRNINVDESVSSVAIEPTFTRDNVFDNSTHVSYVGTSRDHALVFPQQTRPPNIMTSRNPSKNMHRIIATSVWSASGGFSDAAPGALLPTMEAHYNISYSIVSLIWMANAAGFILIAGFSHKIQPWFGKQWSVTMGCLFSVVAYACIASGGPFPLIVAGFFFSGMGLATVLAQSNVFLAKLDKQSKYLAIFHACYGGGATVLPLAATSMVNSGIKWNYVYLILLALMLLNSISCYFAFKGANEDLKPWDHDDSQDSSKETSEMRAALSNKITWLIAFFVFCYQGSEVSLGGWIVTYLLDYRHVSTKYGYVLSGFWGGITVGRLVLTRYLHKNLGTRKSVILLALFTILMIVLSWVVPSSIAVGLLISCAGTMIGPTYPLMITAVAALVPRKIQVVSLTIMTAFGSSGGALLPFFIGLIAQGAGAYVVLPIFISAYTTMLVIWLILPNVDRKSDLPSDSKLKRFLHRLW